MVFKIDPYRSLLSKVEEKGLGVNPEEVIREWEKIRGNDEKIRKEQQLYGKGNDKDKWLYIAGHFRRIGGSDERVELEGYGVVRYDLRTGKVEKVVGKENYPIESLFIDNDKLYITGGFLNIRRDRRIKFKGRGVIRYDLRTGKVEKVIDRANSRIESLFIDNDKLYMIVLYPRETMITVNNPSPYEKEVVEYNLKTGKGKVIERANSLIERICIDNDKLYITGGFIKMGRGDERVELEGYGVVRYDLRTGKVEKVIDGVNDRIRGLFIDGVNLYIAGNFTKIGTGNDKIEFDGFGVARYNLETEELRKIIDGADSEICDIFIDNGMVYIAGHFRRIGGSDERVELEGYGVVRYDLRTGKVEKVIDGADMWTKSLFLYTAPPKYNEK